VEEVPPITLLGGTASETIVVGSTTRDTLCNVLKLAKKVIGVGTLTLLVETVKFADVCPPPTITLGALVATALPLNKATATPPGGAGPLNVTVPAARLPPVIVAGAIASWINEGGIRVRVVDNRWL
jgi:hypothetical protein